MNIACKPYTLKLATHFSRRFLPVASNDLLVNTYGHADRSQPCRSVLERQSVVDDGLIGRLTSLTNSWDMAHGSVHVKLKRKSAQYAA